MDSATARIMEDLALYGPGRIAIEDDPLVDERDFAAGAASLVEMIASLFDGTALERHVEDIAWSLVNVFHRKIERLERDLRDNETAQRAAIAEQDGSEVKSVELERLTARGQGLIEHVAAFEAMREAAADAFAAATGSAWRPRSGTRKGRPGLTSAVIDARDFIRARKEAAEAACNPDGPLIAFSGGQDWTDVDAVFRVLDKIRGRHPDMVLCHTAQATGADLIAAKWAEARGVAQIPFRPDFGKHHRAAPFRRNDDMIAAGLTGAILFPGNGITANLGQKAERAGVAVLHCGRGR